MAQTSRKAHLNLVPSGHEMEGAVQVAWGKINDYPSPHVRYKQQPLLLPECQDILRGAKVDLLCCR